MIDDSKLIELLENTTGHLLDILQYLKDIESFEYDVPSRINTITDMRKEIFDLQDKMYRVKNGIE